MSLLNNLLLVHDKGQMCNNIIQYGHVYAWAREHHRRTLSLRFAYKYRYFHIRHTPGHNIFTYAVAKLLAKLRVLPTVVCEDYWATEEATSEALARHRVAVVTGWNIRFYDLFEKYRTEIRNLFTFDEDIQLRACQFLEQAEKGRCGHTADIPLLLGVHIRRGDYDRLLGGAYYYDDEVYIRAIRRFQALHPGRELTAVVCGNVRIDHRTFREALPDVFFLFPDGNAAEDLSTLAICDYIIGPPSSYSLVASMYRDAPLHFLASPDEAFTLDDFHIFDYNHRHFDSYFYGR